MRLSRSCDVDVVDDVDDVDDVNDNDSHKMLVPRNHLKAHKKCFH